MTHPQASNVDPAELAKFAGLAARWWDPKGECRPLHQINPLRLEFIEQYAAPAGKRIADLGCGGGILSEALAIRGATVVGVDLSAAALAAARVHLQESGLNVDYREIAPEDLAIQEPARFDIVTCMELLEHLPDPKAIINAGAALLKPGGAIFFATLNRTIKSYLFAIVGAEYVLNLLPRGTHDHAKFIRPSELAAQARLAGLNIRALRGLTYNPLLGVYSLGSDLDVNYLAFGVREEI